jgi:alpha-mannosidase II
LFGPKGPAKRITELPRPEVKLTTGPLFSQLKVAYKSGFIQKWTLYNTVDIQRMGLYLTQEITLEIEPNLVESEVILRFKTDIDNKDIFFTDQNGFQLIGRKNDRSRLIESNYYPMSTMAIIEDNRKRLTLHSAQSHGVASLENGWLEVMLDRNMQHDDGKGLGQGAYERVVTLTEFIIQVEYKPTPYEVEEARYTHASVTSTLLNEQLQNKPQVFSAEIEAEKVLGGFEPFKDQKSLSCDISIVGLRILVTNDLNYNGTSLVLHRRPKHCSYPVPDELSTCSLTDEPRTILNFSMGLDMQHLSGNVLETSLSHLHTKAKTDLRDDIRPDVNEMRAFLIKTTPP